MENQELKRQYKITVANEKNYDNAPAALMSFMPKYDDILFAIDDALCNAENCFVALGLPREELSLVVVSCEIIYQ